MSGCVSAVVWGGLYPDAGGYFYPSTDAQPQVCDRAIVYVIKGYDDKYGVEDGDYGYILVGPDGVRGSGMTPQDYLTQLEQAIAATEGDPCEPSERY